MEVRVLDETGANLGVMTSSEALAKANERGLDLIEISSNTKPPVAKIFDFGKFLYDTKKKDKITKQKSKVTEIKNIQIKIGTGEHDLEMKARRASGFLKEGHRVKIELFLSGRSKYLKLEFLKERLQRVLNLISENYKIVEDTKKVPKGLGIVIERDKNKKKHEHENQQISQKENEVDKNGQN